MERTHTLNKHRILAYGPANSEGRYVLTDGWSLSPFATHHMDHNGATEWGHYFRTFEAGLADLKARVGCDVYQKEHEYA